MADNVTLPLTGVGDAATKIATDQVTYSGDSSQLQVVRLVHVTGAEGSKVVGELVKLEDAAHTSGDPGVMLLAVRNDAGGSLASNTGDYIPLITDANGNLRTASANSVLYTEGDTDSTIQGGAILFEDAADTLASVKSTNPLPVVTVPSAYGTDSVEAMAGVRTSGGATIDRTLSAGTTNAKSVKASAGQIYGWYVSNAAAYAVFWKLYNTAGTPTAGSGTPLMTIGVPAGAAANVSFPFGIAFSTGIGHTITKLVADNDTTAVAANDLVSNLFYK